MRNICFNNHLKKLCQQLALIAVVLSVSIITPAHQALAQSSRTTFDYSQNGILYYDNCGVPITSGGTDVASGVNLEFPTDLKDEDIAKAIDDYIKQAAPDSILIDTGKYIVASSRSANVSPFLTVAHAKVESALGKPGISIYVDQANNAFKRSAVEGSGEPSLPSIHKVKPYFWSSPRASVDHTAPENQTDRNNGDFPRYLRSSYNSLITDGNIEGYINEYFKSRSISSLYKDQFIQVLNDLTKLSKGEEVKPASTNSSDNICCNENNTPVNGSVNISGSTNAEKVFNYLTAKGFNAEQAAAVVGNLMQESGGGTEDLQTDVVNSIGASGMIQWLYDRKDRLMEAAKRMGKPWQDIEVQIYFMGWEVGLEGSETYGGRGPTHSQVGEMMKNASSLESATRIWLERYEIPCNPGSGF